MHKSRSTSTGPWQCSPRLTNSPGNDHTWREKCSFISTVSLAKLHMSTQTAPEAKNCYNKLTEAYISISLWLWKEGRWLHVTKLEKKKSQFPSTCRLPCQLIEWGLLPLSAQHAQESRFGIQPRFEAPFLFKFALLLGNSLYHAGPRVPQRSLAELWRWNEPRVES